MTEILPLRLQQASVLRRGKRLIGPIDLAIAGRGITILVGPNGSGKTTLLRTMHGLERLSKGTCTWAAPQNQVRNRQAFVFQTAIMMRRSVVDCIAYPLRLAGHSRHKARDVAMQAAREAGLGDILDVPAPFISGGEKQKLALARALITNPDVLFLDEPCASLDGQATRDIEGTLLAAAASGVRVVMSTHDLGQARRLADEIVFLARGCVLEHQPAPAFFTSPMTPEAKAFQCGDIVE